MNQIVAKVIKRTRSPFTGIEITSMLLVYPRFIHSELMTHRVFSRSASSSRAIPIARMIAQVLENTALPVYWGINQSGMQADTEADADTQAKAKAIWISAAKQAATMAAQMSALGLHKQVVNRMLEPFQLMRVIVTATEWDNFFVLRNHKDAQPEIAALAIAMREAFDTSEAVTEVFHLPFLSTKEEAQVNPDSYYHWASISAARCARVSYNNHDGSDPDVEKDLQLFDRLITSEPMHASPCEHQALLVSTESYEWAEIDYTDGSNPAFADVRLPYTSKNFIGWTQFREYVENSNKRIATPLPSVVVKKAAIPEAFAYVFNLYNEKV